ncbi:hypothetical protein CEXT_718981 [Caerostris extrusa]|uniref:Uncharacterized protein n=1 Tax=Caerostris extrusa TaxID=172846 RepID=A0AAV4V3P9_CAEEX|nr:hypothetical protein CEXT_718981 [Caerostris extrusa]
MECMHVQLSIYCYSNFNKHNLNNSADKKIQNIISPYVLQHHTSFLISKDTDERILPCGLGGKEDDPRPTPSSNPLTNLKASPKVVGHLLPGLLSLKYLTRSTEMGWEGYLHVDTKGLNYR